MASWNKIWKRAQEAVSFISALGTLLIGIATLWITIRVSGLEDYFMSEIAVRNEQLVTSSEQLRHLQSQQGFLQKDISEKNLELARVQQKIRVAEAALNSATQQRNAAMSTLDFKRKLQAWNTFGGEGSNWTKYFALNGPKPPEEYPIGEDYFQKLEKSNSDSAYEELRPYISLALKALPKVCPDLRLAKVILPASVGPTANSDAKAWQEYKDTSSARNKKLSDGMVIFQKNASECLCTALSLDKDSNISCKRVP